MKITCECVDDAEELYNLTVVDPTAYRSISTVFKRISGAHLDALAEVIDKVRRERHAKAEASHPPVAPWSV